MRMAQRMRQQQSEEASEQEGKDEEYSEEGEEEERSFDPEEEVSANWTLVLGSCKLTWTVSASGQK